MSNRQIRIFGFVGDLMKNFGETVLRAWLSDRIRALTPMQRFAIKIGSVSIAFAGVTFVPIGLALYYFRVEGVAGAMVYSYAIGMWRVFKTDRRYRMLTMAEKLIDVFWYRWLPDYQS